jgi:hypothetical protein
MHLALPTSYKFLSRMGSILNPSKRGSSREVASVTNSSHLLISFLLGLFTVGRIE